MKDSWPDLPYLIQTLLEDGKFPASEVISDLDANSYEHIPLVSWNHINQGQHDHGLWQVLLSVSVMVDPFDGGLELLPHIYRQIRSWNTPGIGVIESEHMGVEQVEDQTVHNPTNAVSLHGKHIAQFDSQFTLLIRDWS